MELGIQIALIAAIPGVLAFAISLLTLRNGRKLMEATQRKTEAETRQADGETSLAYASAAKLVADNYKELETSMDEVKQELHDLKLEYIKLHKGVMELVSQLKKLNQKPAFIPKDLSVTI